MPVVRCDGQPLELRTGESLLEAALRAGLQVPHSCRAGACQSCLVKATAGTPPPEAQAGLRPSLVQQGFLLACLARPTSDLAVSTDAAAGLSVPGQISGVASLGSDVVRVEVTLETPLPYRAGQYVTLLRPDGLARSYSVANVPDENSSRLEFHVRVLPGGQMSGWLASGPVGAAVSVRGPNGECFYQADDPDASLVLAGTGTGLAPLWGILHDALAGGHRGPIQLLHGARTPEGLYLTEELRTIASVHPQVTYAGCVLDGATGDLIPGALDDVLFARVPDPGGQQLFLCGDPGLVQKMKRRAFLAGARLADIHADAFVTAPPPAV